MLIEQGTIPAPSQMMGRDQSKEPRSPTPLVWRGRGQARDLGRLDPPLSTWLIPRISPAKAKSSWKPFLARAAGNLAMELALPKEWHVERWQGRSPVCLIMEIAVKYEDIHFFFKNKTWIRMEEIIKNKKKRPLSLNISRFAHPRGFGALCSCLTCRAFQSSLRVSVPK